ncbi:MAG: LytR C-terminal domain-containing protein [Candidatus Adiutrix sp.]|nr:LytR C-terminal domain-containing protein [Candidatus Adiutrix sp.]
MLPPEDQTISALTPPPAPADPEPPEEDGAAIGRAGSLLTKEYYGQAQILPSLDSPPALEDDASKSAAPAKADAAKSAGAAKGKPAPAAKGQAEAKTEPTRTAKAQDSQGRTPAPPRGSLALVNETGDPQVGAVYQSALSRLGYTILAGPAGGFSQGPAGQTVIYYRPGAQDRALAVSRDLPGRKTLAEAPPGAAASDVIVVLR